MRARRGVSPIVIVGGLFLAALAVAKVEPVTLPELVSKADVIVVANVKSTKPSTAKDPIGGVRHEATLRVREVMKGIAPRTVVVSYYPEASVSPNFAPGERCIVFLLGEKNKYSVLRKVALTESKVRLTGVVGESREQSPDSFLNRVRTLVRADSSVQGR
jgi:hypothetical protein